jgi:hypothetical protein
MSQGYILLITFEQKTAFLPIISQKVCKTNRFFTVFVHSGRHEGVFDSFDSFDSSTTTPCLGPPPANSWRTKQFLSRPTVSSSFKVKAQNFRLRSRHDVKSPSLLVTWEVIYDF